MKLPPFGDLATPPLRNGPQEPPGVCPARFVHLIKLGGPLQAARVGPAPVIKAIPLLIAPVVLNEVIMHFNPNTLRD